MAGRNLAIILGRLGRDPETTMTQAGMAVCKFSMATSRKQKNGEEVVQWHRLTAFQKAAELIQQYVKKGDQLYVEGEINYSQYEKNGVTKYSTDIIVREFSFISSGGGQGNQGGGQGNQGGGYQNQQNQNQQQGGYNPQQNQNQQNYNEPGQPGYNPQNQQQGQSSGNDDVPF